MTDHMPLDASSTLPSHRDPTRRRLAGAQRVVAVMFLVGAFASGVLVDRVVWDGGDSVNASSSLTDHEAFAVFQQTWDLIHDRYIEGEAVDEEALIYGASAGMVEALGDTGHSRFLTPEEADDFDAAIRGEVIGIGVQLDIQNGFPVVVSPIDGSPADLAGIKAGDVIETIDGEGVENLDFEDLAMRLRGEEGTRVNLTLRRPGLTATFDVTITRAKIKVMPVSWRMLPDGVAQIRLSAFSADATDALEAALRDAKEAGAGAVILDLRDNPGGLVHEAVGVASQLMPEGSVIFQERARDGAISTKRALGPGEWQDRPLVVLINEGSASAAEIVAAALRANDRAVLIGETTFGTGTVLSPFPLEDGSVALLGTALWLTPDGEQIWQIGVDPDVEIGLPTGVFTSRPQDDADVTPEELGELEDSQLREAHRLAAVLAAAP